MQRVTFDPVVVAAQAGVGDHAVDLTERRLGRKPRMLVSVALANKMARIVWALLVRQEDYRAPVAVAA